VLPTCKIQHLSLLDHQCKDPLLGGSRTIIPLIPSPSTAGLQLLARLLRPSPSLMEQGLLLSTCPNSGMDRVQHPPCDHSPCASGARGRGKSRSHRPGFLIIVVFPQMDLGGSDKDVWRDSPCPKHCDIPPAKAGRQKRREVCPFSTARGGRKSTFSCSFTRITRPP